MTPACCWQHGISMIQISLFGVHNNLLRCFWNRLPNPYLQPCMLVKTGWGMLSPLLILPWCIGSKRFWQEFAYFTGRPKTINVIELWLVVTPSLIPPLQKKKGNNIRPSDLDPWKNFHSSFVMYVFEISESEVGVFQFDFHLAHMCLL